MLLCVFLGNAETISKSRSKEPQGRKEVLGMFGGPKTNITPITKEYLKRYCACSAKHRMQKTKTSVRLLLSAQVNLINEVTGFFVPARIPSPCKTPPAHKSNEGAKIVEEQPAKPTVDSAATKRSRLPSESESEQSQSHKKARSETEEHEEHIFAQSISNAPNTVKDPDEHKELHFGSNESPPDDPLIPSNEDSVPQTAENEIQEAESAYILNDQETDRSASTDSQCGLPEPTQDLLAPKDDHTTTTRVLVKQESTGIASLATLLSMPSPRTSSPTIVGSGSQNGKLSLVSVPVQVPITNETRIKSGTPAINIAHQTGVTDVIDLTDDRDNMTSRDGSTQRVNVRFVDEYGEEQHVVEFDECNTAESMFVEACAWDIADKETKMLEVIIPGCKPARVGKNNEKHFAQEVFEPLKDTVSRFGQGQSITLTVQKYM